MHLDWKKSIISLILCLIMLAGIGCGAKKGDVDTKREQLLGAWRLTTQKTHRILRFLNNGTWKIEVRIEGALNKVVEKSFETNGPWRIENNNLIIQPSLSVPDIGWMAGKETSFEIVKLDKEDLQLRKASGKVDIWKRVRSEGGKEGQYPAVNLDPIVVNLRKKTPNEVDRYLCVAIDLVLVDAMDIPAIHPRVIETILFFFSSMNYDQVDSFDEIAIKKDELFTIIRPYLDGKVTEIIIKRIIVTANSGAVENFIASFASQKKSSEGAASPEK